MSTDRSHSSNATRWSRDEIGEYHDGRGNLVVNEREGWRVFLDGSSAAALGPFSTLREAKAAVDALDGGEQA